MLVAVSYSAHHVRVTFTGLLLNTGASSGIGAGTAVHFASFGCHLALCGRNSENLQNVVKQCINTGLPEEKVSVH
jgi:NADP-dependent 3-hydroxy acid dehydrogenase YdfG